jgi:hypothetical protein
MIFWIVLTIYWPLQYKKTKIAPPEGSSNFIPPTLSYKILDISSDSLTYDGEKLNGTNGTNGTNETV